MGKHEHDIIEEAEKIIVKILNGHKITPKDKNNPWYCHALSIAMQISADYPNFKSAKHLGNRYDNTGDILLKLPSDELYLEIKMSDTKSGIGTKANISQDALTENKLFIGDVISWSSFRKAKNHELWVSKYLNLFNKYPKKIINISNGKAQIEEKARYLRDRKIKIKNILKKISEEDRKEKLEYLNYLCQQKQNSEMIKRFYILLMLGIHKKEFIADLINKEGFFDEVKNLLIYYGNRSKGDIMVRKEDVGENIGKFLKSSSVFKIVFPVSVTHCKIIKINQDKKKEELLQVVFHWKNIAQGIKTPCLNIFDLNSKPN